MDLHERRCLMNRIYRFKLKASRLSAQRITKKEEQVDANFHLANA